MQNKLTVFDWMRTFAILIIVFHHLPGYTFNYYDLNNFGIPLDLSFLNVLNRYLGLSIFIFISGYLLNARRAPAYNSGSIKKFITKRWVRIFPLYILALGPFIYLYKVSQPERILVHLLGLQLITASPQKSPINTLWFVGLIVVYYSIFLIWKSQALNSTQKLVFIVAFPVLVFFANSIWDIMDMRLLLYYGIFWFGIYCGTGKVLEKLPHLFLPVASFLAVIIAFQLSGQTPLSIKEPYESLGNFLAVNGIMFSFVIFCYYAFRKFPDQGPVFAWVEKVAYASYCVYLFHRPVFSVLVKVSDYIGLSDNLYVFTGLVIVLGLPVLFFGCLKAQQVYDRQIAPAMAKRLELIG